MNNTAQKPLVHEVITSEELLKHWQEHRDLTRRVIEAFPEKEFFNHRIGGMRTFAEMSMELLGIGAPGIREIATGEQNDLTESFDHQNSKEKILQWWDEDTKTIDTYWKKIPQQRFQERITVFGQYEGTVIATILYFIDNEIHHRGQGYVYLRSLGVEPPAFWDRDRD